jgi:hypothetical protein
MIWFGVDRKGVVYGEDLVECWDALGDGSSKAPEPLEAAYRHFCDHYEDPSEIGIEIIEGDTPGSTYCVARLICSAEVANEAAERLGWAERFRRRKSYWSKARA